MLQHQSPRSTLSSLNSRARGGRLGKLYEKNFVVNGAKLFNILPKKLRDMVNITFLYFKSALDKY